VPWSGVRPRRAAIRHTRPRNIDHGFRAHVGPSRLSSSGGLAKVMVSLIASTPNRFDLLAQVDPVAQRLGTIALPWLITWPWLISRVNGSVEVEQADIVEDLGLKKPAVQQVAGSRARTARPRTCLPGAQRGGTSAGSKGPVRCSPASQYRNMYQEGVPRRYPWCRCPAWPGSPQAGAGARSNPGPRPRPAENTPRGTRSLAARRFGQPPPGAGRRVPAPRRRTGAGGNDRDRGAPEGAAWIPASSRRAVVDRGPGPPGPVSARMAVVVGSRDRHSALAGRLIGPEFTRRAVAPRSRSRSGPDSGLSGVTTTRTFEARRGGGRKSRSPLGRARAPAMIAPGAVVRQHIVGRPQTGIRSPLTGLIGGPTPGTPRSFSRFGGTGGSMFGQASRPVPRRPRSSGQAGSGAPDLFGQRRVGRHHEKNGGGRTACRAGVLVNTVTGSSRPSHGEVDLGALGAADPVCAASAARGPGPATPRAAPRLRAAGPAVLGDLEVPLVSASGATTSGRRHRFATSRPMNLLVGQ